MKTYEVISMKEIEIPDDWRERALSWLPDYGMMTKSGEVRPPLTEEEFACVAFDRIEAGLDEELLQSNFISAEEVVGPQ